ncbi:MAG TPA: hypothetical protein VF796_20985, partial [Humisphaera sp.]
MAGPTDAARTAGTPALYAPRRAVAARASFVARVTAMGVASACMAVLVTAARLTPSPSGVGSHRGLGMASCGLLERTGLPCPGCG